MQHDFKVDCNSTVSRSHQTVTNMTRKRFIWSLKNKQSDQTIKACFETFRTWKRKQTIVDAQEVGTVTYIETTLFVTFGLQALDQRNLIDT